MPRPGLATVRDVAAVMDRKGTAHHRQHVVVDYSLIASSVGGGRPVQTFSGGVRYTLRRLGLQHCRHVVFCTGGPCGCIENVRGITGCIVQSRVPVRAGSKNAQIIAEDRGYKRRVFLTRASTAQQRGNWFFWARDSTITPGHGLIHRMCLRGRRGMSRVGKERRDELPAFAFPFHIKTNPPAFSVHGGIAAGATKTK